MEQHSFGSLPPVSTLTLGGGGLGMLWGETTVEECVATVHEAVAAGSLLGTKTILNELIAYIDLASLPAGTLDPRATQIMVYAMCGFANFASVGILIAGYSTLVPERRDEIVPLAMRAIVSGTMASGLTGAMIGLLPVS